MESIKNFFERYAFGVCSYLGEKMGVSVPTVRLYFIYLSFATLGSPVLIYLFMAFWLNIRTYIRRQKQRIIW